MNLTASRSRSWSLTLQTRLGKTWVALMSLGVLGVVGGALFPATRLVHPSGDEALGFSLSLPAGYVALAPLSDVLDAMSLLSASQHFAVLNSLAFLYLAFRVWRGRSRKRWSVRREALLLAGSFATVFLVYGVGVAAPRPMAALATSDERQVAIDFHSHTSRSHDGNSNFSAEDNRRWHAGAGFHVAYVTDHWKEGQRQELIWENPPRAGDRTILLPGREFVHAGQHVVQLATALHAAAMTPEPIELAGGDGEFGGVTISTIARQSDKVPVLNADWDPISGPRPVLLQTLPGNLARVATVAASPPGVVGIELHDASPRGIDQSSRSGHRIQYLADSLNLAVVAGSNNHGWGRTAAAWSIMAIPEWRSMTPLALGARIERDIQSTRRGAVQVVARRGISTGGWFMRATTLPRMTITMFRTLSVAERVSWCVWFVMLCVGRAMVRGPRRLATLA